MLLSWRTTLFISHPFSLFYSILNQDASVVTRVRNRIDNLLFEKLLYLPILKQSENLSSLISHSAFFLSKNLIIPTRVKSITIQFSNSSWNWNEKCLKDTFARIVYHYFFEKLHPDRISKSRHGEIPATVWSRQFPRELFYQIYRNRPGCAFPRADNKIDRVEIVVEWR